MKKLCFGTLLNLVYQAKGQGVTYKSICDAVFSAYGCADTTNRDSSLPPHLKSGHDNVPPDVIDAARAITYEDAVIAFDKLRFRSHGSQANDSGGQSACRLPPQSD